LTVLGAVVPHFRPNKREIWHGGVSRLSGQRVALRKTHFWTIEKNNTGMAALRAGLPVMTELLCGEGNSLKTHIHECNGQTRRIAIAYVGFA